MADLNRFTLRDLRKLRDEIIAIPLTELRTVTITNATQRYASALYASNLWNSVHLPLRGHESTTDQEHLGALREHIVEVLSNEIASLAQQVTLDPVSSPSKSLSQSHAPQIELRLLEQPSDIRDAAYVLSEAFKAQAEELRRLKPNGEQDLERWASLLQFFESMDAQLHNLSEGLDRLIANARLAEQPIFLGRAGDIAKQLELGLTEWLEENRTKVWDYPIKVAGYGLGFTVLTSIFGVPPNAVLTFVAGLLTGHVTKTKG